MFYVIALEIYSIFFHLVWPVDELHLKIAVYL